MSKPNRKKQKSLTKDVNDIIKKMADAHAKVDKKLTEIVALCTDKECKLKV